VASITLDLTGCVLLAVDLQTSLINAVEEGERVLSRCEYLIRAFSSLGNTVISTTQNASKLGPLAASTGSMVSPVFDKTSFSCWGDEEIRTYIWSLCPRQIVVCGAETHICVSLTAQDLVRNGYEVAVCPDSVGASNLERHKLGMERMRDGGVVPIHSEAAVYELMGSSDHPKFREILELTKRLR
jgi:hypothetical protein